MKLGTIVQLRVKLEAGYRDRGMLVAHESYTDFHGTRTWLYVRWFDSDGRPDTEAKKHHAEELEEAS